MKIDLIPDKIKGSHVGIVISFVIFIGFITFLYPIITGPISNIFQDDEQVSKRLEENLLKNVSEEITIFSVKITSPENELCISFENLKSDTGIGSKIIAKNSAQVNQEVYISGGNLEIDRDSNNDELFKIIYSEEFDAVDSFEGNCKVLSETGYRIGLLKKENYTSERKIIDLLEDYETDYENLRETLLGRNLEFDFTFTYANKTKVGQVKEVSTNVYSKESSFEYISNQGEILLGTLNLRVWK
jgi:hypothetical protein|tara:strand:- start:978 stop:1709 length:732 start_codon:yes stop_codon:yes gene_type:complete